MPSSDPAPGARILRLWQRLSPLPGGRLVFAVLLGRMVPYSGTIRARIEALAPGASHLRLRDHRRVRNHLHSIHAVALTNLGELASGLALITALDADVQAIVTRLETRFLHKARGRLDARCRTPAPRIGASGLCDFEVMASIHDEEGVEVAQVRATWRLRRHPEPPGEGS